MRLEIIQSIQLIIIAFLSYVPTVTLTGWFEAWTSKKCGDDTPEQFGFLTLNPFVHFSVFGFGAMLFGLLLSDYLPFLKDIPGFGRFIPVMPSPFARWKAVLQFHARACMHIILIMVAFFTITTFMYGYAKLILYIPSSYIEIMAQIMQFFFQQNFLLAVIFLSVGTFRSIMFFYWPDFYAFLAQHTLQGVFILFATTMVLYQVYARLLQFFVGWMGFLGMSLAGLLCKAWCLLFT